MSGEYNNLQVSFSEFTEVENGCDYIYIMDDNGNVIGDSYTGTTLVNKTITVLGNTIKVKIISDYRVTKFGFGITKVIGIP